MKAVVFPNLKKELALSCAREVCDVLQACNITPIADPELRALFFDKSFVQYQPLLEAVQEAEFAIAIGGDGTILRCASHLIHTNTKLLGINTGRLGFMAALEPSQIQEIARLRTGDYRVSSRMLLCGDLLDLHGHVVQHCTALNDITIARQYAHVVDFQYIAMMFCWANIGQMVFYLAHRLVLPHMPYLLVGQLLNRNFLVSK